MRLLGLFVVSASIVAASIFAACGEDEAIVRERLDSGADVTAPEGGADAGDGGLLGCGVGVPTTYTSPAFATNAAVELALTSRFEQLDARMAATEGDAGVAVTAAELKTLYGEGSPSLRAVSTPSAQAIADAHFDAFEEASGKTWRPADAAQDGGAPTGGKYGAYHFSATGVDLREATTKTLLAGAFYNHVLGLVAAPMTEATIDRLLAAYGASPAFADRGGAEGGAGGDTLVAALASRRDDALSPTPGPYRKIRSALLAMKAAVPAGEACKPDLDAAVTTFLAEWERATYATAVYYLAAAATTAADPLKGPEALRAWATALGLIRSFKGLPADKRKITDAQIDALLAKIGATTAYRLVTSPGDRVLELNQAINDIALYEGFTQAEIESFKVDH
jgi:hypothetical protein